MAAQSNVLTLEAVNALVPRLAALMETQMSRRADIEERIARLVREIGRVPDAIEIADDDPAEVRELKREIIQRVAGYQAAWSELEEMGAVLKDPSQGLVDFYGLVDGKRVWLCWKYGEKSVTDYHGLDEGFSGRKPIEAPMRHRHLN
jgi:hypothetical protein